MYNSIKNVAQLIDEAIKLTAKAFKDSEKVMKIIALTLLIGNKFVSEEEYKQIWEANKMILEEYKAFRVLRDIGREEGREEGEVKLYYTKLGYSVEQIAEEMSIPEERVRNILEKLLLVQ